MSNKFETTVKHNPKNDGYHRSFYDTIHQNCIDSINTDINVIVTNEPGTI